MTATIKAIPYHVWAIAAVGGVAAVIVNFAADADVAALLTPLVLIGTIAATFWRAITVRERRLAVFEVGNFAMLSAVAFGGLPLLFHLLSGMELTVLSSGRILAMKPTPQEFGNVGWMYVIYMAAFAVSYLAVRGPNRSPVLTPLVVSKFTFVALLSVLITFKLVLAALNLAYGIDFSAAYDQSIFDSEAAFLALPLAARQVVSLTYSITAILSMALVVVLVSRWRSKIWRVALVAWLLFVVVDYFLNPGGRFRLMAMIIAALAAYDRFVGRLPMRKLILWGGLLFAFFMVAGMLRGTEVIEQGAIVIEQVDNLRAFFAVATEFQINYGCILEIKYMMEQRLLDVPWQIHFMEVLLLIPSQLLPFDKLDVVDWFNNVSRSVDYFTYGPLAQSVVGFGTPELILRGAIVGGMFAGVHNFWASRPNDLWRNTFYIWLSIYSYFTVRNTSLSLLTPVLNQFLVAVLMVAVLAWALRSFGRRRSSLVLASPSGARA